MTDQIMTDMSNDFFGSSAVQDIRENARRNSTVVEDKKQAEYIDKAAQVLKTQDEAQKLIDYNSHAVEYQNQQKRKQG